MIVRQLFDPETSTYSYLLGDPETRVCALIDPVLEQVERDRTLVDELGLQLAFVLETHVHADHVTSSGRLRAETGAQVVVGASTGVANADVYAEDGQEIAFGSCAVEVLATPGHTAGCVTYVVHAARTAFTGDALLIRGCGRTDFQQGSSRTLFRSVRERIFALPDDYLLYPGHDYKGRTCTTVAEEKRWNARLALDKDADDFDAIMGSLRLAYPKRMDVAVPANLECGLGGSVPAVASVASLMQDLGRQDSEPFMGMGI